jgi:Cdc6-like AAA superfamily ATPase
MAVSLANLKKVRSTLPPRTLIYGPPGLGKTTLASEFPAPAFIQVEDGTPAHLELDSFGLLTSYEDVISAIGSLYAEEHSFQTVALDSVDKLEPLVWQAVCEANKWESIESPGYGKGYLAADTFWRDLLGGLNALRTERGMTVILIGHSEVGRFDDPRTASYSRFDIRLHKRALALVEDEMDLMIFLNQEATVKEEKLGFNKTRQHAEGGIQRWMYLEGRPSLNAKNRYGMPPKLPFNKGNGFASLAPYLPHLSGTTQPAETAAA